MCRTLVQKGKEEDGASAVAAVYSFDASLYTGEWCRRLAQLSNRGKEKKDLKKEKKAQKKDSKKNKNKDKTAEKHKGVATANAPASTPSAFLVVDS